MFHVTACSSSRETQLSSSIDMRKYTTFVYCACMFIADFVIVVDGTKMLISSYFIISFYYYFLKFQITADIGIDTLSWGHSVVQCTVLNIQIN